MTNTLKWDAVPGAVSYVIYIRTEETELDPIINVTVPQYGLAFLSDLYGGQVLYFSVSARDKDGYEGFRSNEVWWHALLPVPQNVRIE